MLYSDIVYNYIKKKILSNELPTGYSLSEEALSKELKVSRTPIREALRKLEVETLVEIKPHRGTFVKKIKVEDINEIFLIREALEGLSANITATLISEDNLKILEEKLEIAEKRYENGLYKESSDIGNQIHNAILRIAGNKRILNIISNLSQQTAWLKTLAVSVPGRLKKSNYEHRKILEALKLHKSKLAEKRMKEHIIGTKKDIIKIFKNKLFF